VCYFHSDIQSSCAVVLRNYVSIVCHSATDIVQQAAGLVAYNYRLFEAASKIVAAEVTGLCRHFPVNLMSSADVCVHEHQHFAVKQEYRIDQNRYSVFCNC